MKLKREIEGRIKDIDDAIKSGEVAIYELEQLKDKIFGKKLTK